MIEFSGFDWDDGNRVKCQKHGVSLEVIESLFRSNALRVEPDLAHSSEETRSRAIGALPGARMVFLVYTLREINGEMRIRPISARYMHKEEIESYEKENP